MSVQGVLNIACEDKVTKEIVYRESIKNTICNALYDKIVNLLADNSSDSIAEIQVGVGTTVPLPTDTALASPITPTIDGTGNNTITFAADGAYGLEIIGVLAWDSGNGFAISEAGLRTTAGTLVARATFAKKMKSEEYNFIFTWTLSRST